MHIKQDAQYWDKEKNMSTPKMPKVQAAPIDPAIDPEAQAAADEASRRAKARQQKGISATKTILTSGVGVTEDEDRYLAKKQSSLG